MKMDQYPMSPQEDRNEPESPYAGYYGTGSPHRNHRRGGGWAVLLIVLVVLLSAGLLLARNYVIRIDQTGRGIVFSLDKKDAADDGKGKEQGLLPPLETETETETETAAAETAKTPAAVGTGAELEISERTPQAETTVSEAGTLTLQEIYQKVSPSVVSIETTLQSETVSGTGIVMTADGYLITNAHVVENGVSYRVLLHDGTEYAASLVGEDTVSDLGVLKIDASGLTPAEFGDSGTVQVGDAVAAIGDPLGIELRGTMTDGIISAINRDITTNGRTLTLLQTNAQLNNGNSGGPLINVYGQVIGINTMKIGSYSATSVEGLGFAIPIATAKPIIDELIEKGYVSGRPALGIQGESVPAYAQAYYRLPDGVYVSYVYENSDAYQKGLQQGDIITAIDGTAISSMDELNTVKNQHVAGDTVKLTVFRSGSYYDLDITLMDQKDAD